MARAMRATAKAADVALAVDTAASVHQAELVEIVDRLGAMTDEVDVAKQRVAEYDRLRKELVSKASAGKEPGETITVRGRDGVAKISSAPAMKVLKADAKAVIFELLGNDRFVEFAQFPVGKIGEVLTDDEQLRVFDTVPGSRRCVVTKL